MTEPTGSAEPILCEGHVRSDQVVQFTCGQESIIADVGVDPSRGCYIQFMRQAFSDEVAATSKPVRPNMTILRNCVKASEDGIFTVSVPARSAERWNPRLTQMARKNVLMYQERSGSDKHCDLRIPKVYRGDPFFHVYRLCSGRLNIVWEFPIPFEDPADFAHWIYMDSKGNLPKGTEARIADKDLWFETIRTNE